MVSQYTVRDAKGRITGSKYPPELVAIIIDKYPNHSIAECA